MLPLRRPVPSWTRSAGVWALLVLLACLTFVALRIAWVADGSIGRFVVLGTHPNAPAGSFPGVPPTAGPYDGEFYYRLALHPFDLRLDAHGIDLGRRLRQQRVGYPLAAWAVSLGRPRLVPYALVAVNIASLTLVAWLGGLLARSYRRTAAWGLLVAGFGGFITSLGRDLSEPLTAALLLAALLALRRERPLAAAVALTGAALTRETALLLPAAMLLCAAWRCARQRRLPRPADAWPLLPVAVWLAWQCCVKLAYGAFPVTDESGNTGRPFVAAAHAVAGWVRTPSLPGHTLSLLGVASLAVVVVTAVVAGRRTAPPYVLVALALATVLVLSLSSDVWNGDPAELRTFTDVHLFGTAVILTARSPAARWVAAVATVVPWLGTVHHGLHLL
jgi:hypothetical protein